MTRTHAFLGQILENGRVDDTELPAIREYLECDGQLDGEDVRLLVELYCNARYGSEFAELFFDTLHKVLLADGEILPSEQFMLLKMLYSDRVVHQREKQFLRELRGALRQVTPEFDELYREAMAAAR